MNTLEDQIKISRKVIIEMLTDRGYNTTNIDNHIPDMIFATLFAQFENEPFGHAMGVFDFNCENFTGDKIYVKYIHKHIKKKIKKTNKTFITDINFEKLHKKVKDIRDILFNDQVIYVICDTNDVNIEENEKIINLRKKKNVEVFDIKRVMINITKHFIVPKHEKVSIEEVNKLKKILRIKDIYKLPTLMIYDPVSRYFNFKQGDVIKITRNSKSTGTHISYRVCIENEDLL
tara:strand:- start:26 stop:721 length:696 start_codon:yes stop_codon:yes gene_type:complete